MRYEEAVAVGTAVLLSLSYSVEQAVREACRRVAIVLRTTAVERVERIYESIRRGIPSADPIAQILASMEYYEREGFDRRHVVNNLMTSLRGVYEAWLSSFKDVYEMFVTVLLLLSIITLIATVLAPIGFSSANAYLAVYALPLVVAGVGLPFIQLIQPRGIFCSYKYFALSIPVALVVGVASWTLGVSVERATCYAMIAHTLASAPWAKELAEEYRAGLNYRARSLQPQSILYHHVLDAVRKAGVFETYWIDMVFDLNVSALRRMVLYGSLAAATALTVFGAQCYAVVSLVSWAAPIEALPGSAGVSIDVTFATRLTVLLGISLAILAGKCLMAYKVGSFMLGPVGLAALLVLPMP